MNREVIVKAIQEAAVGNRLTCTRAHELAQTLNVPLSVIGSACDELHIKISGCQLGCF